jgi:hypothetical protein
MVTYSIAAVRQETGRRRGFFESRYGRYPIVPAPAALRNAFLGIQAATSRKARYGLAGASSSWLRITMTVYEVADYGDRITVTRITVTVYEMVPPGR